MYDFLSLPLVGLAIGLIITVVAAVKKEWGPRLGGFLLLLSWGLVFASAMNYYKDFRITTAIGLVRCLALAHKRMAVAFQKGECGSNTGQPTDGTDTFT